MLQTLTGNWVNTTSLKPQSCLWQSTKQGYLAPNGLNGHHLPYKWRHTHPQLIKSLYYSPKFTRANWKKIRYRLALGPWWKPRWRNALGPSQVPYEVKEAGKSGTAKATSNNNNFHLSYTIDRIFRPIDNGPDQVTRGVLDFYCYGTATETIWPGGSIPPHLATQY